MKPTREQITNAEAGQQLDEWVAEFVMGWEKRVYRRDVERYGQPVHAWYEKGADVDFYIALADSFFDRPAWNPSDNVADAMYVAEQFDEYRLDKGLYRLVRLVKDPDMLGIAFSKTHSLQVLICRAALLAVLKPEL